MSDDDPNLHPDRSTLFGNEQFTIATTQAVSLATALGIVSQFEALSQIAGRPSVLVALTGVLAAAAIAVLAAWCRHQYKMWDVKRHPEKSGFYLRWMRKTMAAAAFMTGGSFLVMIVAMWAVYLCGEAGSL
ncbi:hypothetical protein AAFN88_17845 [Pelagibius sp. CAU 1746]|uniref:hypothetical protein n=1 Tax=Pelagibius sp. CAU 1746 TaxID=3140370 RepID=UPI00325B4B27